MVASERKSIPASLLLLEKTLIIRHSRDLFNERNRRAIQQVCGRPHRAPAGLAYSVANPITEVPPDRPASRSRRLILTCKSAAAGRPGGEGPSVSVALSPFGFGLSVRLGFGLSIRLGFRPSRTDDIDAALEVRAVFNGDAGCGEVPEQGPRLADLHFFSRLHVASERSMDHDVAGGHVGVYLAVHADRKVMLLQLDRAFHFSIDV